jgi:3-hydroxybutyryl-CoA dehydrogenase
MLTQIKNIAVIGAGTMGIGIAEVAASCNQQVKIFDLNYEFAKQAKQTMAKRLESRVQRGKITTEFRQNVLDNIEVVANLPELSDSDIVIEAIVENLEIKQNLFTQLQFICSENTLFASNTSSISITAIASVLEKPENMIGLHFFNPTPVMKLVEVVSGLRSSKANLDIGIQLCHFWKKVPVLAQSSPGFIVNRVARPFYGEAMKMLQEQVAKPEEMDAIMTSAGFRMGPFTLMDLIGIDINLSVSKTVFANMYNDPRYRPSLIQEEMVAANLLGKKTGQGFYHYDGQDKLEVNYQSTQQAAKSISFNSESNVFNAFKKQLTDTDSIIVTEHQGGAAMQINDCSIVLSNGQTCKQRLKTSKQNHLAQLDLMLDYEDCPIIHLSFDESCPPLTQNHVVGVLQLMGKKVIIGKDKPALIAMRTICLLINEAADAIENGVCNENDVETAMQKGVNYPIGLITWAHKIGINHVVETLDNLHHWFGDDRYRVSPWLREKV